MKKLKTLNPNLKIGVGGCVAQQERSSILKRSSNVDFVFGTDKFEEELAGSLDEPTNQAYDNAAAAPEPAPEPAAEPIGGEPAGDELELEL